MIAKKLPTSDDLGFTQHDQRPVHNPGFEEILQGRKAKDPVFNCAGMAIAPEVVLMRRVPDRFTVELRLGDKWFSVMSINPGDPAIKELSDQFTVIDKSDHQIENERQADQRKREAAQSQQASERRLRDAIIQRQQIAEAKRLRNLEGRP